MRVLAVDDEMLQLEKLEDAIYESIPEAMVFSSRRTSDVLRMIEEMNFDVAFLDVQMRGMTGIDLAHKMKEKNPKVNIIFVTAYDDFKSEAMDLRASGYITKPVSAAKILEELNQLRYPIETVASHTADRPAISQTSQPQPVISQSITSQTVSSQPVFGKEKSGQTAAGNSGSRFSVFGALHNAFTGTTQPTQAEILAAQYAAGARSAADKQDAAGSQTASHAHVSHGTHPLLYIQCFGNFDVFDGSHRPLRFERSKAKEMLAYLVFRHGSRCSNREIAVMLFEDEDYNSRVQDSFRHVASAMMKALKNAGAEKAILKDSQNYAIDVNLVECDYFRFLASDPTAKIGYSGDFMSQYSWAEYVNAYLDSQI